MPRVFLTILLCSLTLTGFAQTATSIMNGVYNAARASGSDIGAKANAAYAFAAPLYTVPTIYIPAGSYTYSMDMYFAGPVTLRCEPGTILNYTGKGNAVKMGADGIVKDTVNYLPYRVEGCQFTGGISAAHGIFFNEFIVKSFVDGVTFLNFGGSSTWAIWYQGRNWDSRVNQLYFWGSNGANGIYQDAADPADLTGMYGDYGQSNLYVTDSHIQGSGVGMYINGFGVKVSNTNISRYNGPNIQLGGWGNGVTLESVYMERGHGSAPCIAYGDARGPRVANIIYGLSVLNTYCNLHNTDFGTKAVFLGPAAASAGLINAAITLPMIGANPKSASPPFVVMNNITGQTGNTASGVQAPNPIPLHTTGANISAWGGDAGELAVMGALSSWVKTDATGNNSLRCGSTAAEYCQLDFRDYVGANIGGINTSGAALANKLILQGPGGVNGFAADASGNALLYNSLKIGSNTVIPATATGNTGSPTGRVSLVPGAEAFGISTMVSGTVKVSPVAAACAPSATCVYKLANCGKNASTGIGTLSIGTVSAGTSFIINSLDPAAAVLTTDASTVCWQIN